MSAKSTPPNSTDDLDLCDAYFSLLEDCSECPLLYHRWSFISAVGALIGRQAYLPFGIDTYYPNMYVCLLGNAGTRKSSAIKVSRNLLETTGYNLFARERSSKEKFIKDMSEGFGNLAGNTSKEEDFDLENLSKIKINNGAVRNEITSEVYINAGELEDFLGQGDGPFVSLLTNMWDNLPKYEHGKMTSKDLYIHEPTVNLIGGCTPTTFNSVFPPEVVGQGMLSRMILVFGEGARKKITFPPPPNPELFDTIGKVLYDIKENIKGPFIVSKEAEQIWDDIYQSQITMYDARFENYLSRRHVHYYKLCMVLAAMELSMEITKDIAIKANTILHFTETLMSKALGQFGKARNADVSATVYNVIIQHYSETGQGMAPEDIFKEVSNDFESYSKDFTECLRKLKNSRKIKPEHGVFTPIIQQATNSIPHTNLSLLREYKDFQQRQRKGKT